MLRGGEGAGGLVRQNRSDSSDDRQQMTAHDGCVLRLNLHAGRKGVKAQRYDVSV